MGHGLYVSFMEFILDMMNAYGDRLPATTRMAAMKCVISIVKRNEFRLESLGFNDATISIDKDSEKVCKRYCTLLTKSLIFATKRMNEVNWCCRFAVIDVSVVDVI